MFRRLRCNLDVDLAILEGDVLDPDDLVYRLE